MPYGYKGIVKDILDIGFKLPDWIDYSYDDYNDEKRFTQYCKSIDQLCNTDINDLIELWHRDKYILEHNRNLFYTKPRVSLVDLISQKLNL